MKKKKYQKWMFAYAAVGGLGGTILSQIIKGEFDLSISLGAVTAAIILFAIDLIRIWKKRDKTPDFDEQTIDNILKYFAYASNVFILMALLLLSIITLTGVTSISISYLWIVIIAYLFIGGLGALVLSRK